MFGDSKDELYYDIHQNKIFNTGIEQGTLTIGGLSNIAVWYNIYLPDLELKNIVF